MRIIKYISIIFSCLILIAFTKSFQCISCKSSSYAQDSVIIEAKTSFIDETESCPQTSMDFHYFDEFLMMEIGNKDTNSFHILRTNNMIKVWLKSVPSRRFVYVKGRIGWVNNICLKTYERSLVDYSGSQQQIVRNYSRFLFSDTIFELERIFFQGKLFSNNVFVKTRENVICIYNTKKIEFYDTLKYIKQEYIASVYKQHEYIKQSTDGKIHPFKTGHFVLVYPSMPKLGIWPGVNQDDDIIDDRVKQDGTVLAPDIMPLYPNGDTELFNDLNLKLILQKFSGTGDRPAFSFLITTSGTVQDIKVHRMSRSEEVKIAVMQNAKYINRFFIANNRGEPVAAWYTLMTQYSISEQSWTARHSVDKYKKD